MQQTSSLDQQLEADKQHISNLIQLLSIRYTEYLIGPIVPLPDAIKDLTHLPTMSAESTIETVTDYKHLRTIYQMLIETQLDSASLPQLRQLHTAAQQRNLHENYLTPYETIIGHLETL
jgi:hypothetical protein